MAAKGKPRQKAAKGHVLPEPIPENLEITDLNKKTWVIGKEIGSGGFGTVYNGALATKPKELDYVIKIEHHGNGPLFVEIHCYKNIGKPELLTSWCKKQKLNYLGLSPCYGVGSFEYNKSKYRFMVLERYGKDLQSLLEQNGGTFPPKTVYLVALSILDTIEYIHSAGYIHGDIKAANLLLGRKKGTENQVYLVDLGLACKYVVDSGHKKNQPNPKKAHDGTLAFLSRDAHNGTFARRSDLEILCFNMLKWLAGMLPWEKCTVPKQVQKKKESYMENIDEFLEELFPKDDIPDGISTLLNYVYDLEFEDEPDYDYCRKILKDSLKKIGGTQTLIFNNKTKVGNSSKSTQIQASDKENAKKTAPKAKQGQTKRKEKATIYLEPGVIPTPAMLEILNKTNVEKSSKTSKKS